MRCFMKFIFRMVQEEPRNEAEVGRSMVERNKSQGARGVGGIHREVL